MLKLTTTPVSRRSALRTIVRTGAVAAVASAIPPDAFGATESRATAAPTPSAALDASANQGAGFYRTHVGAIDVTVVSDGSLSFDPYPLFGANVGRQYVEQALADAFLPVDRVSLPINTLLIKSGRDLVLVDAGGGDLYGPRAGQLVRNLGRAGVTPGDVTHLLITHLHRDHVGGALDASGNRTFPNARILMHRAERDFWAAPEPDLSRSAMPDQIKAPTIAAAKRFLEVNKGDVTFLDERTADLADGVVAVHAPGHTPGHLTVSIANGGDRLIYLTDLVHHHAVMLPHPNFHVSLDTDVEAGARARQDWFSRFVTDRALVAGAHLPFPALGHLRQMNGGAAWAPVEWRW